MKILGLIPARGGSKSIPNKNIRLFGGKPLITYSIELLKKSKLIDRIIVSTDSKKIADISKKTGAEIPFYRPKKLSQDNTPMIDVIKHTINHLKNMDSYNPDIITLLQPPSPLRTLQMVEKSIKILKKSNSTSVISVAEVKTHPFLSFCLGRKYLKPFLPNFEKHTIRQKRKPFFYPTGLIYTFRTTNLTKFNSLYGPKIMPLIVKEKELNVDIDDPFDWFIGEMTLKNWKNFKKF